MWIDLTDLRPAKRCQDLLSFIVHRSGQKLSRTKLVKMMYMADYEAMRFLGVPVSEFAWQRRDYGPFDPSFYFVEESLEGESISVEVDETKDGYTWHGYVPLGSEPEYDFSPAEASIIQHIIDAYATMDTRRFVDEVVYETEPFVAVKDEPHKTLIPMEIVLGEGAEEIDGLSLEAVEAGRDRIRSGQGIPLADALSAIRGNR